MATEKSKDPRVRNWLAVVYPDSLPENWRDILDETSVPWCESPLHDKDIDGDGNPKKPHIHLVFKFGGKKSFNQVKELLEPLNCPIPKECNDIEGAVRYMAHLDTPHKHPYPPSGIVGHNGFDPALYIKATVSMRYELIDQMLDFIAQYNVTEFMDFMVYAKYKKRDTWYPLLCDSSAFIIKESIKSNRHRVRHDFVDPETGEILVTVPEADTGTE